MVGIEQIIAATPVDEIEVGRTGRNAIPSTACRYFCNVHAYPVVGLGIEPIDRAVSGGRCSQRVQIVPFDLPLQFTGQRISQGVQSIIGNRYFISLD